MIPETNASMRIIPTYVGSTTYDFSLETDEQNHSHVCGINNQTTVHLA